MPDPQWYWARTHDMPAMIQYLDHWATAALWSVWYGSFDGGVKVVSSFSHDCGSKFLDILRRLGNGSSLNTEINISVLKY
ncbi:hypothetical protein TNCV_557011 [Trichonephila clavipes]|uniref:Uncharacterized protein n=1 Tax=Trichonephila clavipes TaxID=2585209 RepID=A0A8X6RKU3_TRICX|nr:hypothetical protein TNCV_557011 [Trichonephila clavipes]